MIDNMYGPVYNFWDSEEFEDKFHALLKYSVSEMNLNIVRNTLVPIQKYAGF